MKNETLNKIRILKIWEMLQAETDEEHPMGTEEIIERLAESGIVAHRTTIYIRRNLVRTVFTESFYSTTQPIVSRL